MNEQMHTPGEWTCSRGGESVFNIRAGNEQIALVKKSADAYLITAAPELLEVLEHIIAYGMIPQHWTTYRRARAAIAKATGAMDLGGPLTREETR